MGTVDLDRLGAKVKVKWRNKEYLVNQFTVEEQPELDKFRNITEDNALERAQDIVDMMVKRFLEADKDFPEEEFRKECTFGMMNALVTALTSAGA